MQTTHLPYSLTSCTPRVSTSRTPGRKNHGKQVAKIAEILGSPLMPWQQLVADVATEYHIVNDAEIPYYREVIVTVPRQAGKSTLLLALFLHRALLSKTPQRLAYTCQTGWDARKKLLDDWVPIIEKSAIGNAAKRIYRGAGNEAVVFKNESRLETLPTTSTAGHGRTLDVGAIDEAFSDTDDRREQAMLPAMATRKAAQLFVVSTAGTNESAYLRRKVAAGRAAVAEGITKGMAYFEWSALENDDPDDEATYWRAIPSLGITVDIETIRHARRTMTDNEFRRAWLNTWTQATELAIPAPAWNKAQEIKTKPGGELAYCLDISLDRAISSIAVADELGRLEVIETRPGTGWVVDRLTEIVGKHGGRVAIDMYGPAGAYAPLLEAAKITVEKYALKDICHAANRFYDALIEGRVKIRPNENLDRAAQAVRKKPIGSSWLWARNDPAVDLTPLLAASVAYHCATDKRAKPIIRSVIF